jgi:hypothetical protein
MSPVIRRTLHAVDSKTTSCEKRAYGVHEAANYMGTSAYQIRAWVKSGDLSYATLGNGRNPKHVFDKIVLDRFLDKLFDKGAAA